jgi:hypothetical protein
MTSTETAQEPRRCLGCRHLIRSAESLATGYGAGCRAKMRAAAKVADLSAWTPSQVEEARQVIEDSAVVPSTREGVFHVVSSDGSEVYRTHRDGCSCTNGLLTRPSRPCWHRCAIAMVLGITAPAVRARAPIALPSVPAAAVERDLLAELEAMQDFFFALA